MTEFNLNDLIRNNKNRRYEFSEVAKSFPNTSTLSMVLWEKEKLVSKRPEGFTGTGDKDSVVSDTVDQFMLG